MTGGATAPRPAPPVVLTIAGFDPSSGAGITADLKVFAAHGLYGMACITALTVQSTLGVKRIEPVSGTTIAETLAMLGDEVAFAGIKIGMLATAEAVAAVTSFLRTNEELRGANEALRGKVVLDPVIRSSSGKELLDPAGVLAMHCDLLAIVGWITPNLEELAILTGMAAGKKEDIPTAASHLKYLAEQAGNPGLAVLVTGGHLDRPDDYLLAADGTACWLPGERVQTTSTHGTGCALSSALMCRLVLGDEPREAARQAKEYVTGALRAAYPVGKGRGPMNHLFKLD